ncbi:endonuclease [Ichthyenterobacterium magnum]|uniref:Putative secreted protein (Por secretion system target) n=1 Tax=Ichthyenterobacterium magnum TaxID=1230530 RepID=A0A420DLD9_9FLAO|nr:endonuclease [Ichthyenterobacterium magnum]RKE95020.1 putative secreted protein (Por secretion system target) [Ichthyenterobacterium magnum]
MKNSYLLLILLFTINASAQIPAGYYDSANGLSGFALKTELRDITSQGHISRSYDQLYDGSGISGSQGYVDTHSDVDVSSGHIYENDGTVLDMYSENPENPANDTPDEGMPNAPTNDPYNFTHVTDSGGNQTEEGDCYNREHLVPQSSFGSNFPMQSDIHHVIPTDCRVNNFRGSLPFGEVASANWTSMNGSKRGSSDINGYSGTMFEPIDEFKGDIARALLYFATRYQNTVDGYTSFDMFNGTEDEVFFPWAIDMLLDWHYNIDPVDQRERDRNNAAYAFQGNANPFVDHPEYANMIWNPTPDTEAPTDPTNLIASSPTDFTIDLNWTASTDNIGVASYDIYINSIFAFNTTNPSSATATGLLPDTNYCFTIKAKDTAGNESGFSNQSCEMTTNNGSGTTDCANEDFTNIPTDNPSGYADRMWTGTNGTWNATRGRVDETITGKAITIDCRNSSNGTLTSPTVAGGIGNLTVTTQRKFTGSDGTFDVLINTVLVGTIPYNATEETTTITGINVEGNINLVIQDNDSGSARVAIDDLSWTCYTALSTNEFKLESVKLYPNPVKNNLHIALNSQLETSVNVFNILGKKVISKTITSSDTLNTRQLSQGIYIIKLTQGHNTITRKFIKN